VFGPWSQPEARRANAWNGSHRTESTPPINHSCHVFLSANTRSARNGLSSNLTSSPSYPTQGWVRHRTNIPRSGDERPAPSGVENNKGSYKESNKNPKNGKKSKFEVRVEHLQALMDLATPATAYVARGKVRSGRTKAHVKSLSKYGEAAHITSAGETLISNPKIYRVLTRCWWHQPGGDGRCHKILGLRGGE
jgi:hypothetical protein